MRDRYAAWQDRVVTEGGGPVEAAVARPAADGCWLADLLGLAPPKGGCERVIARLLGRSEWRTAQDDAIDSSVKAVGSAEHQF